jgi:hypothetical protein
MTKSYLRFLSPLLVLAPLSCAGDNQPLWKAERHEVVTEIGIRRGDCPPGHCPAYSATFEADGAVWYHGVRSVDPLGAHKGHIDPQKFKHLAAAVLDNGILSLQDHYPPFATDVATIETIFVVDGKRKEIRDSGSGPPELKRIELMLDKVRRETSWDE